MHIAMTGATGLLGTALEPALQEAGHKVTRLVRSEPRSDGERPWQVDALDPAILADVDAVIHLAGASVATRWTKANKRRILESRSIGTATVAAAVKAAKVPHFLSSSAVGWYGDARQPCPESRPRGEGFLADVVAAWEAAAKAPSRTVLLRTGVVLSGRGGALKKMLLPFRLGLGGPMGRGDQHMPWISEEDWVRAVLHLLDGPGAKVAGPVNLSAPTASPQRDFAKALGRALHRPAFMPMPGFVVGLLFGAMGKEVLLGGQNVVPEVLQSTKFTWTHQDLDGALEDALA